MRAVIKCESVSKGELQPGDLYSYTNGPDYWDLALTECGSSVSVSMRSNTSPGWLINPSERVFRLTVQRDDPAVREKLRVIEAIIQQCKFDVENSHEGAKHLVEMLTAIAADYRAMLPGEESGE